MIRQPSPAVTHVTSVTAATSSHLQRELRHRSVPSSRREPENVATRGGERLPEVVRDHPRT